MDPDHVGMPPPNLPSGYKIPEWEAAEEGVPIQQQQRIVSAKEEGSGQDVIQTAGVKQPLVTKIGFSFDEEANLSRLQAYSVPLDIREEQALQIKQATVVAGDPVNGPRGIGNPFFQQNLLAALYIILMALGDQINKNLAAETSFVAKMIVAFTDIAKTIKDQLLSAADKKFLGAMGQVGMSLVQVGVQAAGAVVGIKSNKKAGQKLDGEIAAQQGEYDKLSSTGNKNVMKFNDKMNEKASLENELKEAQTAAQNKGPDDPAHNKVKNLQKEVDDTENILKGMENDPQFMNDVKTSTSRWDRQGIATRAKEIGENPSIKNYEGSFDDKLVASKTSLDHTKGFRDFNAMSGGYQASRHITDATQAIGTVFGAMGQTASAVGEKFAAMDQAMSRQNEAFIQTMGQAVSRGGEYMSKESDNFQKLQDTMQQISQQTAKLGVSFNP